MRKIVLGLGISLDGYIARPDGTLDFLFMPKDYSMGPFDSMSPLFLAAIEATEEAVYNSLFRATTVTGRGHTVEALPIEKTLEILRKHAVLKN